jgi:RNA polymerase sigma-70 factor (ECF subfamily)
VERVYALAFRLTGQDAEARDVVQDVFLRAFRRIHRFQGRSALGSWLHRITVNTAIDRHRHAARRPAAPLEDEGIPTSPLPGRTTEPPPEDRAQRHELARRVRDLVADLSPVLAAVVVLRYGEGLAYDEIARTLDIPVGTVKSRLNRAHEILEPALRRLRG